LARQTIKTDWIAGLDATQKEKFIQLLHSSHQVIDKLREICYNRVVRTGSQGKAQYDCPSWAYLAADQNGYRRAYEEIIELLSLTEDDKEAITNGRPKK
jgi:hypothetical protein